MQPPVDVSRNGITERENPHSGQRQLLAGDLLDYLRRDLPADAYCRLGITTVDLYPEPSWNFVFGQASLKERTGVYSFARYEPRFYGNAPKADDEQVALLRSFKVLAHESGHMFGMEHCVYLLCIMNGSNHLAETDASPVHLCPVCLRKLHDSVGFDIVERYRALEVVYAEAGLLQESAWVKKRADFVRGN
jgi:archaemetzincin